jgi:hypothetical protein
MTAVMFPKNAPVVRFAIHVENLANDTSVEAESTTVLTHNFHEVHELIEKFHAFIAPLRDASFSGRSSE